jgi:hypothetical protein
MDWLLRVLIAHDQAWQPAPDRRTRDRPHLRRRQRPAGGGALLEPELKLGEACMDGSFVIEQGSIAGLLEISTSGSTRCFKQNMVVMQIQMTKRQGTVPITRDDIAVEEDRLRAVEAGRRPPMRLAGE